MENIKKILLIGCGYWGKNWYRTIKNTPLCELVGVVDPRPSIDVDVAIFDTIENVSVDYTHAIIATNAESHWDIKQKLKCKHVLVEKPCGTETTRENLFDVFPGFIFLHSAQFKKIKSILDSGELGKIFFSKFERASMGPRIRTDVSIIEDYAIHDLYIYLALFNPDICSLNISGKLLNSFDTNIRQDTMFLNLSTVDSYTTFYSSWRNYDKTRKIQIVGEHGTLIWYNDELWINKSRYEKIEGEDQFRNKGYELKQFESEKIMFDQQNSNLELELQDFLNSQYNTDVLKNTHELISKIHKKLLLSP